ncbi:MAG: rhomboid family intramembrane serine protease [Acidimicrobiales bacterium]
MSAPWPPSPPPTAPAVACYRHPKVGAPVTCTRCDRPICTDCMVSAPVGWQCPACLKGAPAVHRMHDIQGGAFSLRGAKPYATYALMAISIVAFVGQQMSPDLSTAGQIVAAEVARGELWRVVTSGFLHVNIIHLVFNMLVLFQLGTVVEARLGRVRFLGIYALSLVGGSIGVMLLQAPNRPAVGASGAVFGLMGAIVALSKRDRSPIESGVGGLLLINLVITFVLPGIAIGGHLGGLVAGALGGLLIRVVGERADTRRLALTTLVLVSVTLSLVAIARPVAEWRCDSSRRSVESLASLSSGPVDPAQLADALRAQAAAGLGLCG